MELLNILDLIVWFMTRYNTLLCVKMGKNGIKKKGITMLNTVKVDSFSGGGVAQSSKEEF